MYVWKMKKITILSEEEINITLLKTSSVTNNKKEKTYPKINDFKRVSSLLLCVSYLLDVYCYIRNF